MNARLTRSVGACLALLTSTPALRAQTAYGGAGIGPTVIVDALAGSRRVYTGFFAVVGFDGPSRLGVRLEGTETWGFLWLSADLTYRFASPASRFQPYLLAGGGVRTNLDQSAPLAAAGAGARVRVSKVISFLGEGRLHYLASVQSTPPGSELRAFLLWTLGVVVVP